MQPALAPPPIIDSALLLAYAHVDDDIPWTGAIHLIVDGERLGRVANLAICSNYCVPGDILLLFCDAEWNSEGCIPFSSVDEAKLRAERGYSGISTRWQESPHDAAAVDEFLREVYEVDPKSPWWTHRCSFCNKEVEDRGITRGSATICLACVDDFHESLHGDPANGSPRTGSAP